MIRIASKSLSKDVLENITKDTADIACIIIAEDALAKIFNATQDSYVHQQLAIAGAFLEELKFRIIGVEQEENPLS